LGYSSFESVFIFFQAPDSAGQRTAVPLPLAAASRIVLHTNGLATKAGKPGVTNQAKRLVERAFVQY
jgi:hypothetical protein